MTSVPRSAPKRNDTNAYTNWQWIRGYLVLLLCLPLFPVFAFLSGRTLPAWITAKLLRAHRMYTETHSMDFRIPPDPSVSVYMQRWWWIPRNWAFNVYLHIVCRSDDDRALHCHPWFNFSIVLDGEYFEHEILEGGVNRRTRYGPGMMKFRWTGRKAHRLELMQGLFTTKPLDENAVYFGQEFKEKPVTTIFITGPVLRRWGFHHPDGWVDAYEWDDFCEQHGIKSMKMDGGSDAAISGRNMLQKG